MQLCRFWNCEEGQIVKEFVLYMLKQKKKEKTSAALNINHDWMYTSMVSMNPFSIQQTPAKIILSFFFMSTKDSQDSLKCRPLCVSLSLSLSLTNM